MSASTGRVVAHRSDQYRPDIEGLRGLAVLLVVIFHAGPFGVTGGFIGVDVFFVISGFLITGLLLRERERHGRIDIAAFYARRARRLLPAATIVIIVTLLASILVVPPLDLPSVALDGAASALSVSNMRFAAQGGYFGAAGDPSPFLHFWSLSVEEQFYLFWPLLLVAVTRLQRPRLGAGIALGILVAVSLAGCIWLTQVSPDWAFYLLPTRAWQLGVGGLLAVLLPMLTRGGRVLGLLGWAGLAAVLVAALTFDGQMAYPGTAALLPTLGAVALVAGGNRPWGPGRVLVVTPMRFLGRISYALYLWHWPLLILPAILLGEEPSLPFRLGMVALAVLLAACSTLLIEEPVREGLSWLSGQPRKTIVGGLMTILLVTGLSVGTIAISRTGSIMGPDAIAAEPDFTEEPLDIGPTAGASEDPMDPARSDEPWVMLPSDEPWVTLPSDDPLVTLPSDVPSLTPDPAPTAAPTLAPTTARPTAVQTITPTVDPTAPPTPAITTEPTQTSAATRTPRATLPPQATALPTVTARPTLPPSPTATPAPSPTSTPSITPAPTPIPPPGLIVIPVGAPGTLPPAPPSPSPSARPSVPPVPSASSALPSPVPSVAAQPTLTPSAPPTSTSKPTPRPTPVSYVLPANVRPTIGQARGDEDRLRSDGCLSFEGVRTPPDCVYGDKTGSFTVALVGDSHAAHWFPAVERIAKAREWKLVVMVKVSCPFTEMPLRNTLQKREYPECSDFVASAIDKLKRLKPDLVITTQLRWLHPVRTEDESPAAQGQAIGRALGQVPGAKAVIVDTPWNDQDAPACLSRNQRDVRECAVPRSMMSWGGVPDREKAAARTAGAALLDFTRVLCERTSCPVAAEGIIRYRDDHHFTATFARSLAPMLDRALQRVLGAE